jgi:hypothetical protein
MRNKEHSAQFPSKNSDITLSIPQEPCVFSGDINQVFG